MAAETDCRQLATDIRRILAQGIRISDAVLHYMVSTVSSPPADALTAAISDVADADNASLCELVFSPDETLQIALEPLLAKTAFQAVDEAVVAGFLMAQPLTTGLVFPAPYPRLTVDMPPDVVESFVSHLKISWQMAPRLSQAVSRFVAGSFQGAARVRLRHARVAYTGQQVDFLCGLFEKLGTDTDNFPACFDFMLDLFAESPDAGDVRLRLKEKKRFYFKALQIAETVAARQQQSNMETLILQGSRFPHVDPEEPRRRMRLIDRISRAMFGTTEYFENRTTAVHCDAIDKDTIRRG